MKIRPGPSRAVSPPAPRPSAGLKLAFLLVASLALVVILTACSSGRESSSALQAGQATSPAAGPPASQPEPKERPERYRLSWLENMPFERLSLEEGLSQSVVNVFLQDSQGFLWMGTQDGLNRYDGKNFVTFKYDPDNPLSLGQNFIQALVEDQDGVLWVGTLGGGLNQYDRATGRFTRYRARPNQPFTIPDNNVQAILVARDGTLWVGTNSGGLSRFDKDSGQFTSYQNEPDDPESLSNNNVGEIIEDAQGNLWLTTFGGGLNRFDPLSDKFRRYLNDPEDPGSLSSNLAQVVYQDRQGAIWVGTFNGGLNRFEPATGSFTIFLNDPDDPHSLGANNVQEIFEDSQGSLWIGTNPGGLNRHDRANGKFYRYLNDPANPKSLGHNNVVSLYEDQAGVLWAGTFGAGASKSDPNRAKFLYYKKNPQDPNSLSDNSIWSILEDRQGYLWVGTFEGGLNRLDRTTGQWTHFLNDADDPGSISSNQIWSLLEDRDGNLWAGTTAGLNTYLRASDTFTQTLAPLTLDLIQSRDGAIWLGTITGGLGKLDPQTRQISYYTNDPNNPNSLSDNTINVILEDRSGFLWVGTINGGLDRFDPQTEQFTHFPHDPDDPSTLSNNYVLSIYQDSQGVIWVATGGGGLNRYLPETGTFAHYTEKNGLPNDTIYGILEDEQGHLWMSTNLGLAEFDPQTEAVKTYDVRDGLQSNEFNQGAYYRNAAGEMFFAGVNGLNIFHPQELVDNTYLPPVVITRFDLFNEPVPVGPESPLQKTIEQTDTINLTYQQDYLTFEFAALHYSAPQDIQYAYMLEGFEEDWNEVGNRNFASYTNLPPGEYTFRVKATNADGVWNEAGTALQISITPPFWETLWFRLTAGLLVVGSVSGVFYLRVRAVEAQRRRLEILVDERTSELQATLVELKRSKEAAEAANRAKSIFLANISHELRTPLNAILGFSQLMIRHANLGGIGDGGLTQKQRENLQVINRSGEHLLGLINDVLEMSKIEAGRTTFNQNSFNLFNMLKGLEDMFRLRAEDKGLTLEFDTLPDVPRYICTDEGKLRQILMNLLGNAVKFTSEGGVVLRVYLAGEAKPNEALNCAEEISEVHLLRCEVEDSGPGITTEELEIIFDPFVQSKSGQQAQEGTGLGLSISLQYAQLMGGDLTARSEPEVGSMFRLEIPIQIVSEAAVRSTLLKKQVAALAPGQPRYRVLVVDDKEVNRELIVKMLTPLGFEVQEAEHGLQALQVWEAWDPQLIFMDMRMPVMDGYEATRRIKGTIKGQATVIIALTASALEEDRAIILSEGCDDYIRKPFRESDIFEAFEKHLGVQFVYEGEEEQASEPIPTETWERAEMASHIASLAPEQVELLAQATRLGYTDQILEAIRQIGLADRELAEMLSDLANNFEHEKILAIIGPAGSEN
ncbi:MAG TPA: two-component regulator propeller domain-containing protein [Anaerolineales bacterium]|nr:two-component regulator propeller domain-containing protein [Anaerolineales bacterium]